MQASIYADLFDSLPSSAPDDKIQIGGSSDMSGAVTRYLELLDDQREEIFHELGAVPDTVLWYRPGPRVWSIGEHLDRYARPQLLLAPAPARIFLAGVDLRRGCSAIGRTRLTSTTPATVPITRRTSAGSGGRSTRRNGR